MLLQAPIRCEKWLLVSASWGGSQATPSSLSNQQKGLLWPGARKDQWRHSSGGFPHWREPTGAEINLLAHSAQSDVIGKVSGSRMRVA